MNNEPVAWRTHYPSGWEYKDGNPPFELKGNSQLLYTHPVKEQGNPVAWRSKDRDGYWCIYQSPVKGAEPLYTGFKELTDEEIVNLINKHIDYVPDGDGMKLVGVMDFARAILRKAQEK